MARGRRWFEETAGLARYKVVETHTEWDLIARCRAGNAAAFEPLVVAYQAEALRLASGLLADTDEAADAVQDAFVRAFHGLDRLEQGSAFGPWFRTVLRNHCIDRLRAPARRRSVSLSHPATATLVVPASAPAKLEADDVATVVRSALSALTPEHREVLVLREIAGFSYEEIARVLGVAPGTVASRIFHARAALKKVLVARGVSLQELLS